ncbi:MAG: hypothetical protein K2H72_07410, partial [Muribaculaceae bacterium]|nr:hypothetical protein [Muribaculaceae bacterium]
MKFRTFLHIIAFTAAIIFGSVSSYASREMEKENALLLQKLDSIIANQKDLVREKEIRISGLRQSLAKAKDSRERLGLSKQLYDEYIVFDSDSALFYASECGKLTSKVMPDNYDEITLWKLNQAFIYTVQGLYDTTMELLKDIDSSRLGPEMKAQLFGSLAYIYSMRSVYMLPNQEMSKKDLKIANEYRDSIQALKLPETHGLLWVPIAACIDRDGADISKIDVSGLKKKVDQNSTATRDNAIDAYWLSRYYEVMGDPDSKVKYMTKAAIYDALIVNREIAAIQELATHLFAEGDLNRAYNYLIYTVEQANLYHNRYRMVNLSDVLPTVRDAYRDALEKRDRRLSVYVIILGILSIILIAAIVFIVVEFHKLKKMRNLLKEANAELHTSVEERDKSIIQRDEAIASLEKANIELNEANNQKLSLLAYAFKLTTQYI